MSELLTDLNFYFVAIPAVLVFGISKGGFGGIFGIVSIPLMSMVISPLQATAILLPLLMTMDVLVLKKFWRTFDKRSIILLMPSATLGVILGYFTVGAFDKDHARLLVGLIALAFGMIHFLSQHDGNSARVEHNKVDVAKGVFWGSIAGFTSFHVHSGGPPVAAYLLPKKLSPLMFAGTTGIFFGLVNWIKLPAFVASGQLSKDSLLLSLVLIPLVPLGVTIGYRMAKKVDVKAYYSIISVVLILIGFRLIYLSVF